MSKRPYIGKSEAQAAAENRSTTYADDHGKSWQVRFDRQEPATLRELVIELRLAYRDEVPSKLHEGPDHLDGGGGPAFSGAFQAYLYGSPMAVDRKDAGTLEIRMSPVRSALSVMQTSNEPATQQMGRIAHRTVVGGSNAVDAAAEELGDLPQWVLRSAAHRALGIFWRRCSDVRLDLGRSDRAA